MRSDKVYKSGLAYAVQGRKEGPREGTGDSVEIVIGSHRRVERSAAKEFKVEC